MTGSPHCKQDVRQGTHNIVDMNWAALTSVQWLIAAIAAYLVGLSKTGIAGLGVLAVALFASVLPPRESTGIVLIVLISADIVAVTAYRREVSWPHLLRLFPRAALGIIAGLWADKFDQLAAFQNFIIMPMTFLSGVFYSIHSLPAFWQRLSHFNPFFYMIDGFRYGFFGKSDVSLALSLSVTAASFFCLSAATLYLLKSGYKLRQ